ncbi:MAG: tetratricopeptide repeat protein [Mariprofundales bacterium]
MTSLSGCATKQHISDNVAPPVVFDSWLQEKEAITTILQRIETNQENLQIQMQQMETKLDSLENTKKQADEKIAAFEINIDDLQQEIAKASIVVKKLPKAAVIAALLGKRVASIEASIRRIKQQARQVPVSKSTVAVTNSTDDEKQYSTAYLAFKSQRLDEAILGFQELLQSHPQSDFADEAYYWLGMAYSASNKPEQAQSMLQNVINNYPNSSRHAAAMLQLAKDYKQQQQNKKAKTILGKLIRLHSRSSEAKQARKLISNL